MTWNDAHLRASLCLSPDDRAPLASTPQDRGARHSGTAYVAGVPPSRARRQDRLIRGGQPLERHIPDALDKPASGELGDEQAVEPVLLVEVNRVHVRLGIA